MYLSLPCRIVLKQDNIKCPEKTYLEKRLEKADYMSEDNSFFKNHYTLETG